MESNNLELIDTHAHLFLCKNNINDLMTFAKVQGVSKIINVGIDLRTSLEAAKTAEDLAGLVFPTIGIHPSEEDFSQIAEMESQISLYPYVAIGEIGLDYYHMNHNKDKQKQLFIAQLGLARKYNLPIIIHNREADADIAEILKDYQDLKKVFHCYSADWEFAQNFLGKGNYFSFTGAITYAKKGRAIRAIQNLPLDKIMVETDCPYLTPSNFRGQENQPMFVVEVVKKIAEVKGCGFEDVARETTKNAKEFFGIN